MTNKLLFELGVEELPPKALKSMEEHVFNSMQVQLLEQGFAFLQLETFATPRRLGFLLSGLQVEQQGHTVEIKGPKVDASVQAIEGFARKWNVLPSDLERSESNNGSHFIIHKKEEGRHIESCIQPMLQRLLDTLPIPKRMRWGGGNIAFSRPVRWLVLMLNDAVVDATLLGVQSSNHTRGHRFHHPQLILLRSAGEYKLTLHAAKVMVNSAERKQSILQQIEKQMQSLKGAVVIDEELLDEVNALNEWPVAILCDFPENFLQIPKECLITSMRSNQKYFHLLDKEDALLPHFITVANIESNDPNKIKEGNERVIVPRLKDAEFFFNKDCSQQLESNSSMLHKMLFEKELGSIADKLGRMEIIAAGVIADQKGIDVNADFLFKAIKLCKCDLLTDMVGEFPSLQGVMGKYYALNDGYCNEIAYAIEQHYYPRYSGDSIPEGMLAQIISLADRVDTICGIFAIGKAPTGTSDPYALRRHAIAVLRIILEGKWAIDLQQLIVNTLTILHRYDSGLEKNILEFFMERLNNHFVEQGIAAQAIQAVRSINVYQPLDFENRLNAVVRFTKNPSAQVLSDANKRIANILAKVDFDVKVQTINADLFELPEEKELYNLLLANEGTNTIDYDTRFEELIEFEQPITAFFEKVMVMTEDMGRRNNRFALLAQVRQYFLSVADISCLQI